MVSSYRARLTLSLGRTQMDYEQTILDLEKLGIIWRNGAHYEITVFGKAILAYLQSLNTEVPSMEKKQC